MSVPVLCPVSASQNISTLTITVLAAVSAVRPVQQAIKMKLQTLDYIIHETDTNDHFVLGCQKQNKKSSAYFNQFCIGSLPDETILYLLLKKPAILEQFDHSKCKHCELVSGFDNFNKRKELLQTQLARSDFYKSQRKSDLPDTLDSEYDDDKRAFLMSFINVRKTLETINSEMNDSQIHFYQTYRSLLKKAEAVRHFRFKVSSYIRKMFRLRSLYPALSFKSIDARRKFYFFKSFPMQQLRSLQ